MTLALIAFGISFAGMTVAFIAAMQRRNYWRSQAGHWEDMTHGAAASLKIADNAADQWCAAYHELKERIEPPSAEVAPSLMPDNQLFAGAM
jgi:hypothetical protein